MDALELLAEFVAIPGPPGQEDAVAAALARHITPMGYGFHRDAKGNFIVQLSDEPPKVVVTAHMDELAMMVRSISPSGALTVGPQGGLFPWKLGEGPVEVLARSGSIPGVLSFGSIHTADPRSSARAATSSALEWDMTRVITGLSHTELLGLGVRPGTRVVVATDRRKLLHLGDLVGSYFLDDRADIVSMLLTLEAFKGFHGNVTFVATSCEEVGGEGALFYLQSCLPDVCIALELGPNVEDAPVELSSSPTVWVTDSYSSMAAADIDLLSDISAGLGLQLQYQALSRGGSDASCAASHGLCGRPITLGLPISNSHGFEIMHPQAMGELARLTEALVRKLA
jgi:putative aminopeptidase FrvX